MQEILFSMKRAYHRSLTVTRPLLEPLGLTPARFDMLFAIWTRPRYALRQRDIRRALGVTAATVSRMLSSLAERGLVTRRRCQRDARHIIVRLTDLALSLLRRARVAAIDTRIVHDRMLRAAASRAETAIEERSDFEYALRRIRNSLLDTAWLTFLWFPAYEEQREPGEHTIRLENGQLSVIRPRFATASAPAAEANTPDAK